MITSIKKVVYPLGLLAVSAAPVALAMQPLNDQELSRLAGRDGIAVSIDGSGLSATQIEWEMDAGTPQEASLLLGNMTLDLGDGVHFELDMGSDNGTPYLALSGSWSDLKARIDSISHSNQPGNSMGMLGLESTGNFGLVSEGGLFNATGSGAFRILSEGDLFWRQSNVAAAPELSLANYKFGIDMPTGSIGLDSQGFLISGDADLDLTFDLAFATSTTELFDKQARSALVYTGWSGGLRNMLLRISAGGIGYGTSGDYFNVTGAYATRSDGLNTLFQTDFDDDFAWIIGQPHGERARAEFSNWQRLGAQTGFDGNGQRVALPGVQMAGYDFRLPLTIDAINAGQGPGGLCFGGNLPLSGSLTSSACAGIGGTYADIPAQDNTLALVARDGGLHAYNTLVSIWEREWLGGSWGDHAKVDEFNWGLLYTFGKVDANIFVRPADGSSDVGFRSDVLLAIQSPGYWHAAQTNFAGVSNPGNPASDPRSRWATNTHFMIADTNVGGTGDAFGIGIVNADVFWQVQDFAVRLVNQATADNYDLGGDLRVTLEPGVWLETDRRNVGANAVAAKYQFRGLFGGGNLGDMENLVRAALLDVNLETNRFVFVLGVNPGENKVPFEGLFDFNGNAYLSIAEPSVPTAAYRIHDVSGAVLWKDGQIELKSSSETPHGRPELSISNHILLGDTAIQDSVLRGNISLGEHDNFGSIVIPSGAVYSSIALRPQSINP